MHLSMPVSRVLGELRAGGLFTANGQMNRSLKIDLEWNDWIDACPGTAIPESKMAVAEGRVMLATPQLIQPKGDRRRQAEP